MPASPPESTPGVEGLTVMVEVEAPEIVPEPPAPPGPSNTSTPSFRHRYTSGPVPVAVTVYLAFPKESALGY